MGPGAALLMSIVSLAVFAYVMYWVIRNGVRAGTRDALQGARINEHGEVSFAESVPGRSR